MKYNFTPYEYLMIDIANNYGNDKDTWGERIQFVRDNINNLEEVVEDADDKILTKKAVNALIKADKGIPTNHVMSLDATSSFLQIMAIIMRCEDSARNSNLIYTGNREDIYTKVLDAMGDDSITRKMLKGALMPMFYGSEAEPKKIFDMIQLIKFNNKCREEMPGAMEFLKISKQIWQSDETTHTWIKPDKSTAIITSTEVESRKIEYGSRSFTYNASVPATKSKSVAYASNFIQSLDGMIMADMVVMAKQQGFQMYGIHDSMWASPVHIQKVRENYMSILIKYAKMPVMVDWYNSMTGSEIEEDTDEEINEFVEQLDGEYALS